MRATIVLATALVLSTNLFAQEGRGAAGGDPSPIASLAAYRECDLQKLEPRLLISLGHDIEGVVAGALREVAKIKLAQPACSSDAIASQVERLVRNGATPAIRYKAYLTGIVLSTPLSFAKEGEMEFQTDEQFFTALARRLEGVALHKER